MRRAREFGSLLVAIGIGAYALPALAVVDPVPLTVNTQGVLRNVAGEGITQSLDVTVRFYSDAVCTGTAPACLRGQVATTLSVLEGVFSTDLPVLEGWFLHQSQLYIEIDAGVVHLPRTAVSSTGYAFQARFAEQSDQALGLSCTGCISGSDILDGSLANAQVASDAAIDISKISGVSPTVHTHTGFILATPPADAAAIQAAFASITGTLTAPRFVDQDNKLYFFDPSDVGQSAALAPGVVIGTSATPAPASWLSVGALGEFQVDGNGNATIAGIAYVWPAGVGSAGKALSQGSGSMLWSSPPVDAMGPGLLVKTGAQAQIMRSLTGSTGQITVTNGNGSAGDPTVSLAANPVLPGTGGSRIPGGSAAKPSPATTGMIRYNADLGALEYYDGTAWKSVVSATEMLASMPIGAIVAYGSEIPPVGWMVCDGRMLSRTDYADLFRTISTYWGNQGNTADKFNIPNLQGRFLRGADTTITPSLKVDKSPRSNLYDLGNTDLVGSYQKTQNQTHTHTTPMILGAPPSLATSNWLCHPDWGTIRESDPVARFVRPDGTADEVSLAPGITLELERSLKGLADSRQLDPSLVPVSPESQAEAVMTDLSGENRPVNGAVQYIIKVSNCIDASCSSSCAAGFADCDTDPNNGCETYLGSIGNCNGCTTLCDFNHASEACRQTSSFVFACQFLACDAGWADCNNWLGNGTTDRDGCEVNLPTDVLNCGTCGQACSTQHIAASCIGSSCEQGVCAGGWADCNSTKRVDGCETDIAGGVSNCGGCGKVCSSNNITAACSGFTCNGTCNTGYADCNNNKLTDGCEINLTIDANNCGTCGTICSSNNMYTRTCGAGTCNGSCNTGFADCNNNKLSDGCEINLTNDVSNCNACGRVCSTQNIARACVSGSCETPACNAGFADCNNNKQSDGCEINLMNDVSNCNACGRVCSTQNIVRACVSGSCETPTCTLGFADCNNNKQSDGCEINLMTDVLNCNACGRVCSTANVNRACSGGSCQAGTCTGGYQDCNGNMQSDGCEVPPYCDTGLKGACRIGTNSCLGGLAHCDTVTFPTADNATVGSDPNCDGWVLVPQNATTGGFHMGQSGEPTGRGADYVSHLVGGIPTGDASTGPQQSAFEADHVVTFANNAIWKVTEVTQKEWKALFKSYNPSTFKTCDGATGDNCPVESVNWYEAAAFANAMSGTNACYTFSNVICNDAQATNVGSSATGCFVDSLGNFYNRGIASATVTLSSSYATPKDCPGYRLPTEAEWEYAYNGNSPAHKAFGNLATTNLGVSIPAGLTGNLTNLQSETCLNAGGDHAQTSNVSREDTHLDLLGWYCFNAANTTHAVGQKWPNSWGLYDMAGNVAEWTWDSVDVQTSGYNYQGPTTQPIGAIWPSNADPVQWAATSTGNASKRGGSYHDCSLYARGAFRSTAYLSTRDPGIGFRLVKSVTCGGPGCFLTCDRTHKDCDNDQKTCETDLETVASCGACYQTCAQTNTTGASCSNWPLFQCTSSCVSPFLDCDGNKGTPGSNGCEVNSSTDPANCGACLAACSDNNITRSCVGSSCESGVCNGGYADCDNNKRLNGCEINLTNDVSNCNACGRVCSTYGINRSCISGSCENGGCLTGYTDCNGNKQSDGCETNTGGDPVNCGGCGRVCSTNNVSRACANSSCQAGTCLTGFADCNTNMQLDGCEINLTIDANNCNACGTVCSSANMATRTCGAGVCNGTCTNRFADCNGNKQSDGCEVNMDTDVLNCNACGRVCSTQNIARACVGGSCETPSCNAGFADCNSNKQSDGCEINLKTDVSNCNACGRVCSTQNIARACVGGSCETPACNAGFADCNTNKQSDGCEINIQSGDIVNCGACGTGCSQNHITATCAAYNCESGSCASGYLDCNSNKRGDGCETEIFNNLSNCGGCGVVCSSSNISPLCSSGNCNSGTCTSPFLDCNNNKQLDGCEINPLTDANNCGGCNKVCSNNHIATPTCNGAGVCNGTCAQYWGDCNSNKLADGCETALNTDPSNCGACGYVCPARAHANASCTATGTCFYTCNDANYLDCNGDLNSATSDGCESNLPDAAHTFYQDSDGDGYGNPAVHHQACYATTGWVSNSLDCNDANAAIKPGATEVCDGVDNDCDGGIDNAPLLTMCPLSANVATTSCNGASGCQITSCNSNWYNTDSTYSDGCECQADTNDQSNLGNSCLGAVNLGTVTEAAGTTFSTSNMNIIPDADSDWYTFTYSAVAQTGGTWAAPIQEKYGAQIALSVNDTNIGFRVYNSCGGGTPVIWPCGTGCTGTNNDLTTFKDDYITERTPSCVDLANGSTTTGSGSWKCCNTNGPTGTRKCAAGSTSGSVSDLNCDTATAGTFGQYGGSYLYHYCNTVNPSSSPISSKQYWIQVYRKSGAPASTSCTVGTNPLKYTVTVNTMY